MKQPLGDGLSCHFIWGGAILFQIGDCAVKHHQSPSITEKISFTDLRHTTLDLRDGGVITTNPAGKLNLHTMQGVIDMWFCCVF